MMRLSIQERASVLSYLEARLDAKLYDTWCRSLEIERTGENAVRIPAANPFYRDWLEKLLRKPLEDAFTCVFGHTPEIVFQVTDDPSSPPAPPPALPPPSPAAAPVPAGASPPQLNPNYTFENFIEGPSNRMAFAAARAVSENPAGPYNPLFIHGGVGLGKTHLLQAISHAILARNPAAKLFYLPCEDFVNEYISALKSGKIGAFRSRYRSADALVVDDIHFLAAKDQSQEEFFHTYNTLHQARRQVVLSSDQPAQDIRSLKQHLLSRFKSGFDAAIMPPTYEMRQAILQRKALARGWNVPSEVLAHIAAEMQTNIRELEGALTKVWGVASLAGRLPDIELTRDVLRDVVPPPMASVSVAEIQQLVARYYSRKVADLQARRWTKSTSQARQICIYLCRKYTGASLQELGSHFGGKDHTTMLYSVRKVEKLLAENPSVHADVERLSREILRR